MKKYKVLIAEDPYDEWGRDVPKTVLYVLANSKKEILDTFSPDEVKDLDVEIYTEAESVAIAKKQLANTIRDFTKAKGETLDELGWEANDTK